MQVLTIEDNEDDYLLLNRYASKIDNLQIEWRTSLQSGLDYIASHHIDVLLLDLNLPDGFGLPLVDQVQAQFPSLPIVILSGSGDDEMALEAVRRGAQDYLVKGHNDEEVVRRCLRYAVERKRVEELFRALLESAPDAMIIANQHGEIVLVNQQTENVFGYRRDELIGKPIETLIPESLHTRHRDHRAGYVDDPHVRAMGIGLELYALRKDGSQFPVEISLSPIKTEAEMLIASTVRDVTERKQIENELAAERKLLRTLIDSTPDYIYGKDTEGRYVMANRAVLDTVGRADLSEITGKTSLEIVPEEVSRPFYEEDQQVIASGQPLINKEELTVNMQTGEPLWLLTTKVPLRDENGKITGLVGISRNITKRKQAEDYLRDERNLLRTLVDNIPDYIFIKDADLRLVISNQAHAKMAGTTPDELVGKNAFHIYPPDNATRIHAADERIFQSGEAIFNLEEDIIIADQKKTLLTSKIPLRDEQGNITGLLGISRDITLRKQAEEQLSQERNLLRALIDSSPDYIFIKDAQARYIVTNLAHAHAVHTTPDELVGKTASEVFPPELAAQFHADDERIIQAGKPLINLERTTLDENGHEKTVLTTKIPLRDVQGNVTGLVGISRDITEHKQLQAQGIELAGERERIRVLQRFITDMSHDLRTPIAIIKSSLYLTQRITDPQKLKSHAEKMEQQLLRLDKLLNESLQMVHLDQQATDLQFEVTEINAYLAPLIREYEPVAAAKHIAIEFAPNGTACFARIDTVEFARAFMGLIENAVTFTPENGNITVRTYTQADQAIVSVQDTGIGIAASDLPHIFERFYRADQARSTGTGGHGLGLSIAQNIIEAHGGSIHVESKPGQGSTFSIQLPVS